jgi:hypothetical protein
MKNYILSVLLVVTLWGCSNTMDFNKRSYSARINDSHIDKDQFSSRVDQLYKIYSEGGVYSSTEAMNKAKETAFAEYQNSIGNALREEDLHPGINGEYSHSFSTSWGNGPKRTPEKDQGNWFPKGEDRPDKK